MFFGLLNYKYSWELNILGRENNGMGVSFNSRGLTPSIINN